MTREALARKLREAAQAMKEAYEAIDELIAQDNEWLDSYAALCQETVEPYHTLRRVFLKLANSQ